MPNAAFRVDFFGFAGTADAAHMEGSLLVLIGERDHPLGSVLERWGATASGGASTQCVTRRADDRSNWTSSRRARAFTTVPAGQRQSLGVCRKRHK